MASPGTKNLRWDSRVYCNWMIDIPLKVKTQIQCLVPELPRPRKCTNFFLEEPVNTKHHNYTQGSADRDQGLLSSSLLSINMLLSLSINTIESLVLGMGIEHLRVSFVRAVTNIVTSIIKRDSRPSCSIR